MTITDPFLLIRQGKNHELEVILKDPSFNKNQTRWSGFSLLHRAAEVGNTQACEILLNAGASINMRSAKGWYTPLHVALANGYTETAEFLIDHGADPWMKSKYGEDPFLLGNKRGFRSVCDEFRIMISKKEMKRAVKRNGMVYTGALAVHTNKSDSSNEHD